MVGVFFIHGIADLVYLTFFIYEIFRCQQKQQQCKLTKEIPWVWVKTWMSGLMHH